MLPIVHFDLVTVCGDRNNGIDIDGTHTSFKIRDIAPQKNNIRGIYTLNSFDAVTEKIKQLGIKPGDNISVDAEMRTYQAYVDGTDKAVLKNSFTVYNIGIPNYVHEGKNCMLPKVHFDCVVISDDSIRMNENHVAFKAKEFQLQGGIQAVYIFNAFDAIADKIKRMKIKSGSRLTIDAELCTYATESKSDPTKVEMKTSFTIYRIGYSNNFNVSTQKSEQKEMATDNKENSDNITANLEKETCKADEKNTEIPIANYTAEDIAILFG